jgi:hypothetical protein
MTQFEKEMDSKGFRNCLIVQSQKVVKSNRPKRKEPQASKQALYAITSPEKKQLSQERTFLPRRVVEGVADKMSYLKFGSRLHTINKLKQA